jgi:hypothetical protein
MGAYENPPLIVQPNYGEIFAKNAQNIMVIAEQRKQEQERKRKENELKVLQAGERKTEYARLATNIKAGGLTENINEIAFGLTDRFSENEDMFAKGEITAEEYSLNKSKYETTLFKLSNTGNTIREFDKAIQNLNLSTYQPNAEVFALIQAYKQGKVDANIIDGKVELKYEDPNGEIRDVDESWLSNPNSWGVVEKFDSDTVTNGLADVVKKQITQQVSTTVETETGKVTTTEERYSNAYGTREQRLNQLLQNSVLQSLDKDELGSYYMDKIVPNISSDVVQELNTILNSENYNDLSEEQKQQIVNDVNEGKWSNRELKVNDVTINSSDILLQLSKRQLAKETLNKVPPPRTQTSTQISTATDPYAQELNYYSDTSESAQVEKLKSLETLIKDNNYIYRKSQGVGNVYSIDEEGNEVLEQQFNLKDPFDVSKALVKIKFGKDTKEGRKLVDDLTRLQVKAPQAESVVSEPSTPAGFEAGLPGDISVNVNGYNFTLSQSTSNEMTVDQASKMQGISDAIPTALKESNIPVTIDNIRKVQDALKNRGVKLNDVLNAIKQGVIQPNEVIVSPKQEINRDFA